MDTLYYTVYLYYIFYVYILFVCIRMHTHILKHQKIQNFTILTFYYDDYYYFFNLTA